MKANQIIKKAKRIERASYLINLAKVHTIDQQEKAKELIPATIEECAKWTGQRNESDSYSPYNKLARLLGRAKM